MAKELDAPAGATSGEPKVKRGNCPACEGTGGRLLSECPMCKGTGDIKKSPAPAPPAEEGELDVWKYRVFSMDIRLDSGGRRVAKFSKPDDADKFHEWLKGLRGQAIDAQNWHARIRELEQEVERLKADIGEWNRPEIALIYSAPETAGKFVIRWASSAIDRLDADDKAKLAEWADRLRERIHEMTTPAQAAKPEMGKEASPDGEAPSSANSSPGETAPKPGNVTSTGTEGVTSRRDETLVPVFVKTTDGQPMTEENARELSEYLEAELAKDRETPFTALLKHIRLRDGHGLRAFAERIGMLPSDFAAIQNGRVEPTAEDVAKIISGLSPSPSPHVETGGQEPSVLTGEEAEPFASVSDERRRGGSPVVDGCILHGQALYFDGRDDAVSAARWIMRRAETESQLAQLKQQAEAWERGAGGAVELYAASQLSASQADQQDGKERV